MKSQKHTLEVTFKILTKTRKANKVLKKEKMLKPYIVEKGIIRIIGKSVSFGGSRPKTGEIGDLWKEFDAIIKCIPNRINDQFMGISINFWNNAKDENGKNGRQSYMVGAEVSSLFEFPFDHECRIIPASRWVYIPVRYDDPDVMVMANGSDDPGFMDGCVFGWSKKWIAENKHIKNDFPEELEIYELHEEYDFLGGKCADVTLAVPIV